MKQAVEGRGGGGIGTVRPATTGRDKVEAGREMRGGVRGAGREGRGGGGGGKLEGWCRSGGEKR